MDIFELESDADSGARAGKLRLPSGMVVETPIFMPVATKLSVKTLAPDEIGSTGTSTIITNGFLSHLEPGTETIHDMGGMHSFMKWDGGIFSDSGGFQFIRKGFDAKVSDKGVNLKSPFSGAPVFLTPEDVIDFHTAHGVDVGMVLDHCPSYGSTEAEIIDSAQRTYDWALRSKEHFEKPLTSQLSPHGEDRVPLIFPITQGGIFPDIRKRNTEKLVSLDLPGYGIGGLSIGEGKDEMLTSLKASTSFLPTDKPRYFMGVGEPVDLVRSVLAGVDVFDSVFPTRNARHRSVLTPEGNENIRTGRWKGVDGPIFSNCQCSTCKNFTRGYIHHLFKAQEQLGPRLTTIHNIQFMQTLVKGLRKMILEDELGQNSDPREVIISIFN